MDNGQQQTPPTQTQVDATEARLKRCEPIALKVLEMMLKDETILLSDATFIEQVVKEQFEGLFKGIVYQHLQAVFNMVFQSLQINLNRAQEIKWGKNKDQVTAAEVNRVVVAQEKEKSTL